MKHIYILCQPPEINYISNFEEPYISDMICQVEIQYTEAVCRFLLVCVFLDREGGYTLTGKQSLEHPVI